MNLLEVLGGNQEIAAMARELGLDPATAQSGAAALLPMVMGGFRQQAGADAGGIGGFLDLVRGLGGGGLLDAVLADAPTPTEPGQQLLGRIFGGQEVSAAVAERAAASIGLGADLLQKMLPLVAMAAAGFMARQADGAAAAGDGGLGGLVGPLMGALGGAQGSSGGLGGLAALLDAYKNGNPLDDILKMLGRQARASP